MRGWFAALLLVLGLVPLAARAHVSRIVIASDAPAFSGRSFGAAGAYRMVRGMAYGAVDPADPHNALIQDIALAPRNAKGLVEYATPFEILMPADPAKGNRTLYFEIVNRGRQLEPSSLSAGERGAAGDGFLEQQGFSLVWAGWQGDLVPPANAADFFALEAPIASDHGKPITGPVRVEWVIAAPATTLDLAQANTKPYLPVSLDNRGLTLTMRARQNAPRLTVPNDQWAFADCSQTPFPGKPDARKVCLKQGFDTDHIYELVYTAQDPIVMGLGLAAIRDVASFLRHAQRDETGAANPLAGRTDHAIVAGISQSGRVLRGFLQLGFNQDEQGRIVFDGAQPHISAAGASINVRFAQPGRLAGTQHTEAQYPGMETPVTYGDAMDPIAGHGGGLLDACGKSQTCPRIIQTLSDTEYWQSSGRADTTDATGTRDLAIPDNVRIWQFSSTQHGGFSPAAALPEAPPRDWHCEQLPDANTYTYNLRAALVALEQWVTVGTPPPPSRYARIDDGTLVPLAKVAFPILPGVAGPMGIAGLSGPEGVFNPRYVYDRGPRFNAALGSGIIDREPPLAGAHYPSLAPQVDGDGNDAGGVRSMMLAAPLGTYTSWNMRKAGFGRGNSCDLSGGYVPFAVTAAARSEKADPRRSLEERYGNTAGYVKAVSAAVDALVRQRLMLAADRDDAIARATQWWNQATKGALK